MGILSIGLNIINLDDINYDAYDLEIIIHDKLWLGILNLKNVKHVEKSKRKN